MKEVATRWNRYIYAITRLLCRLRYWLFRHWFRTRMPSPELADIRDTIDRANKNIDNLKIFLPNRELTKETGDLAAVETQADGKTYDIFIGAAQPSTDLTMAIGDVI